MWQEGVLHAIETLTASAPEDPQPEAPLPDHNALQQRAVEASSAARAKRVSAAAAMAAAVEAQEASKAIGPLGCVSPGSRGRGEDHGKGRKATRARSSKSLAGRQVRWRRLYGCRA